MLLVPFMTRRSTLRQIMLSFFKSNLLLRKLRTKFFVINLPRLSTIFLMRGVDEGVVVDARTILVLVLAKRIIMAVMLVDFQILAYQMVPLTLVPTRSVSFPSLVNVNLVLSLPL